ncbi:hypothetical protein F5B21DRAFT_259876 [Xylaria acuta]|nr:hypothetical protein F5B21DRAFT_259876 [Xylaria acuta]
MCIRVCIHRTSAVHDKRFSAVLNPATGYTVLSPFQDPSSDCCKSPCIDIPSMSSQTCCPWHAGCCKFDEYTLPCSGPQSCNMSVNYHHFLSKEAPSFSVGVLRVYMVDPTFLSHAVRFFKAGVELNLALAKLPELQSSLDRLRGLGLSDSSTAVNKASIASRWYHYQHIKLASAAFLAQLAIYWDMKTENGRWPQRPGREVCPEMNPVNDSDAYLKVVTVGKMDFDARGEWPHIFKQWPNFIESLSDDSDPSLLPWTRDPESGTWRSVMDISWTPSSSNTQASGAHAPSATEPANLSIEQPEQQGPESRSRTKQKHDKHSGHGHRQESTSHHRSQRPPTPSSSAVSDSSSNGLPRLYRLKLSKYDRNRGYRRFHHFPRPATLRSHLKRRSHYYRSNKQVSVEPIAPLDPSLDAEIRGEKGKQVSSTPKELTASTARAPVTIGIPSKQTSSQIQA